jgi:2,5-diketo-D-gluconate reductase A
MTSSAPRVSLNDGHALPQLGLGTWQIPNGDAAAVVETALRIGYTAIDTAAAYDNERGVGEGLRRPGIARESVALTTKLWNSEHGYDRALRAFDASLERLGTGYVDLYLIHWPVASRRLYVETWKALVEIQKQGRARSIGVSNFTREHLDRIADATGVLPAVNQIELHPHFQQTALRAFHAEHGIVTQSWSPLGRGGLLTDGALAALARKHGKTPAQIVLRWHLDSGLIVIPKSVREERLRENFDVLDFALDPEDMADLFGG